MVVTRSRLLRLALAAVMGPLTGPLALRAMACARKGERWLAAGYVCAIPAVWFDLAMLAAAPWTR
jgi:hypothetical protein